MPTQKLRIVQTLRVERSILIDVEADTIGAAVAAQQIDSAPPADDPRWSVHLEETQSETVEAA